MQMLKTLSQMDLFHCPLKLTGFALMYNMSIGRPRIISLDWWIFQFRKQLSSNSSFFKVILMKSLVESIHGRRNVCWCWLTCFNLSVLLMVWNKRWYFNIDFRKMHADFVAGKIHYFHWYFNQIFYVLALNLCSDNFHFNLRMCIWLSGVCFW